MKNNGVKVGDNINVRFTKKEKEKLAHLSNSDIQKIYEDKAREIARYTKGDDK